MWNTKSRPWSEKDDKNDFSPFTQEYKKYLDIYETRTINDAEPERLKKE
jgi:hypothetical protein